MAAPTESVFISELDEQDSAADADYMIIGGSDAKKISFLNLLKSIESKDSITLDDINNTCV